MCTRRLWALLTVALVLSLACQPAAPPTPTPTAPPPPAAPSPTPLPPTPTPPPKPILFLSTQLRPVEEAEKMRNVILKPFGAPVEFIPEDEGPFHDRIRAEIQAGKVTVDVVGALHGNFVTLLRDNALEDLTPLMERLKDRPMIPQFVELGKLGTDRQYCIPWMQATYILAINKKALDYLPAGADVNALTWDQLRQWGENIHKATGERRLGFPLGPKGLIHRFVQGYLYPSYTGAFVTTYKSPEAVEMWKSFKALWEHVNPQSTTYDFMQEPLLAEEVWIAWDHTARLVNAFKERPDDFIAAPAPAGPKGRGFMPVLACLGIVKGAPNREGAEALIEFLTRPETQLTILREVAFFPVLDVPMPADMPAHVRIEGEAVVKQSGAPDAIPALLPVGLGGKAGEFNKVNRDTLERIVLKGEDIEKVLREEAAKLQAILNETGAACWPPDPPSTGPCQVR